MISKVRVKQNPCIWHRIVTWWPRKLIAGESDMYVWAWLHVIERRTLGGTDPNYRWEYRLVKNDPRR